MKKYYQEKITRVESQECATRAEYNRKYYVQSAESLKSRARVKYVADPEKKKASARVLHVVKCNSINATARHLYKRSPGKRTAAARTASRISYAKNYIAKIKSVKQYYAFHKKMCV